jgi:PrtD family type I secretion system ABC transporter
MSIPLNLSIPTLARDTFKNGKSLLLSVGLFSVAINVLMLTGSLFMLEVYDRALPSRSTPTLLGLLGIALMMYLFLGVLEVFRAKVMTRLGSAFDFKLAGRAYVILLELPLRAGRRGDGTQPVRDLDTIRTFLAGPGPTAIFDLPWVPVYLAICFAFHFWIGVVALAGVGVLALLTVVTNVVTRKPAAELLSAQAQRTAGAERDRRNAEVIAAMGLRDHLKLRWLKLSRTHIEAGLAMSDVAGTVGTISRVFRMVLQSVVLATGAVLVMRQEATAGIIIASSIISGRALAPIDHAIVNWKGFLAARGAWTRLSETCARFPLAPPTMELPAPSGSISVEGVSISPPGETQIVAADLTFTLQAGSALGVIGPSASGKSSLARAIAAVWSAARGRIRLDGAELGQWDRNTLGRHIGYLPQDVELMAGTIAENIGRFDPDAAASDVIAAADAAGIHGMITAMKDGYDTKIGDRGAGLSAGQQQRVALARALYGNPFLVVLDEPNSNLDSEGDEALAGAIKSVRARGGIVVVVAHRQNTLASVDHLLAMNNGRQMAFGPRDEILRKLIGKNPSGPGPLVVVNDGAKEGART